MVKVLFHDISMDAMAQTFYSVKKVLLHLGDERKSKRMKNRPDSTFGLCFCDRAWENRPYRQFVRPASQAQALWAVLL